MLYIRNVFGILICFNLLLACAKKDISSNQTSKVSFSLPAGFGADNSRLGVACFAVNITASDIPSQQKGLCDGKYGVFGGLVPLNGSIELEAPRGQARNLEIYYVISDTDCPSAFDVSQNGLGQVFGSNRVFKIGERKAIDFDQPVVEVTIPLYRPSNDNSLATLLGTPGSCDKTPSALDPMKVYQARAVNGAYTGLNQSGTHQVHIRVHDQKLNLSNPTNFSGSIQPARLGEK